MDTQLKILKYPWNITAIYCDTHTQLKMLNPIHKKTGAYLPNALKSLYGAMLF